MSNSLKKQVLSVFKQLHLTRKSVFHGDHIALSAARKRINEEFQQQKGVTDEKIIKEHIKYAAEVEEILRKSVVQAVQTDERVYRTNIRKDIEFMDSSSPYEPMPDSMIGPFKKKRPCGNEEKE